MKRRRLWKVLLALLLVVLVSAVAAAHWFVRKETTPGALVRRLEKSLNCRAEVASASVNIFSFPATLEVKGLRLLPRDEEVEKPLKERQAPKKVETVLAVPFLSADISLPGLLRHEINVGQITLNGAEASTIRRKTGENTLSVMLSKPPAATPEPKPEPGAKPSTPSKPFAAALTMARLTDAKVSIRNEKKKQLIELKEVNISLANLRYTPAEAAAAGIPVPSDIKATLHLTSLDMKEQRQEMDFTLDLASTLTILAGGDIADGTTLDIHVKTGSYLDRIPTLEKLAKKMAKLKDQIGLDLTSFPVSGRLVRDADIKGKIEGGLLKFQEDTNFNFDTCRIKIKAGSWFNPDDQQHEFEGLIAANAEITKNSMAGVDAFLTSKGESLAKIGRETLMKALLNDQGLLTIPFTSTEDIGRPEVTISKSFEKNISNALGDAAKALIKDALDGGDGLQNLIDGLRK